MKNLIRSISGIRGIVGSSFTNQIVKQHLNAFLSMQENGPILLAYDGRAHGKAFLKYAATIIKESGRIVVNCGLIPTPTCQFLVKHFGYAGAVIITASHNPSEWNGLKFIDSDACFTSPEKTLELLKNSDLGISPDINLSGEIKDERKLWETHVDHTLNLSVLNIKRIKEKKIKIIVDAVNCTGSFIIPFLLNKLGCEVICINCDGNGKFSRGAEPLPHNLDALKNAVIKNHGDLGIATDPDGDRLAVVDNNGQPLGEEFTLPFCADGFYRESKSKSPMVVNLSSSMLNDWICKKNSIDVYRSKVGEINVVEKMKKLKSEIGGEGNGGVIFSESHYGRDAIVGTALFLNRLSIETLPLSEVRNQFPHFYMIKDKVSIENLNLIDVINRINDYYTSIEINDLDGIKLIWEDKWIHIRSSNTEPILRIYGESKDEYILKNEIKNIKKIIS